MPKTPRAGEMVLNDMRSSLTKATAPASIWSATSHGLPQLLRLHIAGDGRQRNELELLAKELGISNRVVFHGWVPHEKVADFYLSSQLFVLPARWPELFCLSVLEAMALGMPVVVADYGNIASELDGATLPFKRADTDDLVEKMKLVHGTPSLAASLARKGQEKAKDFDYKRVIPRLIEVYRATIEGATESRV